MSDFLDLDDELDFEWGLSAEEVLVDVDWGVLGGDGIRVLVDEVFVGEGVVVLVGEVEGVLVGEADGDLVGEVDSVLIGEADNVLEGEVNGDGFSSSMIVGLEGGKSSTICNYSWLLVSIFSRMNRTL